MTIQQNIVTSEKVAIHRKTWKFAPRSDDHHHIISIFMPHKLVRMVEAPRPVKCTGAVAVAAVFGFVTPHASLNSISHGAVPHRAEAKSANSVIFMTAARR